MDFFLSRTQQPSIGEYRHSGMDVVMAGHRMLLDENQVTHHHRLRLRLVLTSSEEKNKWVQVRHIKEKQYLCIIKPDICIQWLGAGLTLCLALKFHCAITCIMANKSSFKNKHTQYVLSICCSVLSGRCVGPGAAEAPIH